MQLSYTDKQKTTTIPQVINNIVQSNKTSTQTTATASKKELPKIQTKDNIEQMFQMILAKLENTRTYAQQLE